MAIAVPSGLKSTPPLVADPAGDAGADTFAPYPPLDHGYTEMNGETSCVTARNDETAADLSAASIIKMPGIRSTHFLK
jgi:hypothetical protein